MSVLPVTADTCPLCQAVHDQLDQFWACPKHGHRLQFYGPLNDWEVFQCPAHRCGYQRSAPPKPRTKNGDPMTTIATRPTAPVDLMWHRQKHIDAVLPDHIDTKSFIGTAAAALYANADLMKAAEASPDTLMTALMRCAALGHQPGTEEFYLTPRRVGGRQSILGIEGYRGIVERMYRSGAVATVVVREVCADDRFHYIEGVDTKPVHSVGGDGTTGAGFFGDNGSRSRGAMVGVYAYAVLTTGAVSRVVLLSRDDVLAARDAGGYKPTDQFSPWNRYDAGKDHPEFQGRSMWWKTAARRLEPWVPTSAEYRREQLRAAAAATQTPPPAPEWLPPAGELNDITDAELIDDPETTDPARATTGQQSMLSSLFKGLGFSIDDPDEQLNITKTLAGLDHTPSTFDELTQDQATVIIGHLKSCRGQRANLIELLAEAAADDAG